MGIMERWGMPDSAGWAALVLLIILAEGAMALYTVRRHQQRKAQAVRVQETIQRTGTQSTARFGDFAEGRDIVVRVDACTRNVVVDQRTE